MPRRSRTYQNAVRPSRSVLQAECNTSSPRQSLGVKFLERIRSKLTGHCGIRRRRCGGEEKEDMEKAGGPGNATRSHSKSSYSPHHAIIF
jgi:hypothetical protein